MRVYAFRRFQAEYGSWLRAPTVTDFACRMHIAWFVQSFIFLQLTFTLLSSIHNANCNTRALHIRHLTVKYISESNDGMQWHCCCHHYHLWNLMESNWRPVLLLPLLLLLPFWRHAIHIQLSIEASSSSLYERWRCGYFEGFDWKPLVAFWQQQQLVYLWKPK